MSDVYQMRLRSGPFEKMISGSKNVEYRLYDEKRRRLKEMDYIWFRRIADGRKCRLNKILTRIKSLHIERSFSELNDILISKGVTAAGSFSPERMSEYYSEEDESRFGTVGIELEFIGGISCFPETCASYRKVIDKIYAEGKLTHKQEAYAFSRRKKETWIVSEVAALYRTMAENTLAYDLDFRKAYVMLTSLNDLRKSLEEGRYNEETIKKVIVHLQIEIGTELHYYTVFERIMNVCEKLDYENNRDDWTFDWLYRQYAEV